MHPFFLEVLPAATQQEISITVQACPFGFFVFMFQNCMGRKFYYSLEV
jgi:hypothetical protein